MSTRNQNKKQQHQKITAEEAVKLLPLFEIYKNEIPYHIKDKFVKQKGNEILLHEVLKKKQKQAQQKKKAAHQRKQKQQAAARLVKQSKPVTQQNVMTGSQQIKKTQSKNPGIDKMNKNLTNYASNFMENTFRPFTDRVMYGYDTKNQDQKKKYLQERKAAREKALKLKQQKEKQDVRSKNNSTNAFPRSLLNQINNRKTQVQKKNGGVQQKQPSKNHFSRSLLDQINNKKTQLKHVDVSDNKKTSHNTGVSNELMKKVIERRDYVRTDYSDDDSEGSDWDE